MSTEARKPPAQIALKIRRVLGGKAGWNGVAVQFAFAAILGWIGYEIVSNARANLENQHIAAGFGFLRNNAGFDVNQTLISYTGSDTFLRVFVVGLLNTLVVSVVGIVFATVIGFIVALCRLSPNWLLSRVGEIYVEISRNLPVLFQILFWYLAVLAALPNPRQSISLLGIAFISNRGLVIPRPIGEGGFEPFLAMLVLGIVASLVLRFYARRALFQRGQMIRIWPYVLGLLFGLPLAAVLVFGLPFTFELPQLKGFNFAGGSRSHPGIRGADAGAVDLYRGLHRRDRARRHPVRPHRSDGSGILAGPEPRHHVAPDRRAAGDARHRAAADQPVSQPHQELFAGGRDRLSRPRLGVRRHVAEPDRAGDRDHCHDDGRLPPDLAAHQRRS